MTIRDYQFINSLDITGLTYEEDIINYFKIDKSLTIDEIKNKIKQITSIKDKKIKNYFFFKGKLWKVEKNMIELSYEQFKSLEILIAEGDNIKNLHKLLAIYVRPVFRKYNIKTQDKIYNQLLDLDMSVANGLATLFFSLVMKHTSYITISYLNQRKRLEASTINK